MAAPLHHMMEHPLGIFALLVAIAVLVPPLTRRLRLPDLVGLLAAGVLVGPHCLQWLDAQGETITLLSDIGAIYLLFTVGLEIDLEEFNRVKNRSVGFGLLVFGFGVATGVGIGRLFGFPLVPSLLLGALMATHTPLGYPIVRSYGAQRDESVIVSVGSTILTDIAALLLLAVLVARVHREGRARCSTKLLLLAKALLLLAEALLLLLAAPERALLLLWLWLTLEHLDALLLRVLEPAARGEAAPRA